MGTQKDNPGAPLVECVQAKRLSCRQIRMTIRLIRDEERKYSSEADDFTLSRKATREIQGTRTANRHR